MADGLHADKTDADVYIDDSFEAADAIAQARSLAEAGRWTEAAEALQRTLENAGGKLVGVAPGYYVGIHDHVTAIIAGWPAVGIDAYRSLYESEIAKALSSPRASRTVRELLPLFDRYFCTSAAADLADTIGQLAIESGDLALAEHVYGRVLYRHPDGPAYAVRHQIMLDLIATMRGGQDLRTLQSESDVKIRWMGQDRLARDVITEVGAGFADLRAQASPVEWPIFAGSADRNRTSSTSVDELGLLWRFDAFETGKGTSKGEGPGMFGGDDRGSARHLSVYPVVSGGLVFAQRLREVVALHRNTGVMAWRFSADAVGGSGVSYFEDLPPAWDSVTVHDGRVYASLPGDTLSYYSYESPRNPPELVCLDAATGRQIWRLDQQVIEEEFAEVGFDSSPIIRHGCLYIVGRRRRAFGFEDCYLYRFNAATGELEHRTHLGSASTGTFGARLATRSIVAMQGDTAFVCTDLGTMAAVSVYTGGVRWLRLYQRDRAGKAREPERYSRDVKPWEFNPAIWSDGRVVVMPMDGGVLLVLDADDGAPLQPIPVDALGGIETVFGVHGGVLCGAGHEVTCYDLSTNLPLWSTALPEGETVWGRGVWTDDRLLVPTQRGLSTYRVADGRRTSQSWDAEGEGGNLLVLPDQVLVAGSGSVSAYVRKSDIWKALRERIAAAPSDPLPALELAEVALNSGEFDEAVSALDEAVKRASRLSEPLEPGPARRLYDDVLMFVERLSARSRLDAELLDKLFSYASQYAPDATAHMRYRLRFAELYTDHQQPDRAVGLYAQILRDRSLRELPTDASAGRSGSAGAQAEERISAMIERHGRSVYSPFDEEAKRWLERAAAARDVAGLERLVTTFPNSESAPLALITHGDLLVSSGRAGEAAKQFARAYHRYPKQVDHPVLLRKVADAFEAAGRLEHAYRWLTKAAYEHPSVQIDHEGRMISFLAYRTRLADVRDRVEPSRPDVSLPLSEPCTRDFDEGVSLLVPSFGNEPGSCWSRYFVRTSDGIQALDARTGTELWAKPAPVWGNADLLIAGSDAAVFATPYEVFALNVADGSRNWSHGEYPRHLDAVDGDWEDQATFRGHSIQTDRLVSTSDDGRIRCLAIDTGKVIWSDTYRPEPLGRVRLADPWVVYDVVEDEHAAVCLIDAATGAWSHAIVTEEKPAVEDIVMTLDGQVVVATARSLSAYDPETRRRRWRVPLSGYLRRRSLLLDLDAVYYSDDGVRIQKIGVDDGGRLWESERLAPRGDDDLSVTREGGSVVVGSAYSISAVDAVTGLTLWRGTAPQHPRFISPLFTRSYVVAVDVPSDPSEGGSVAYFYDHRNASGLIARDGGALQLGPLTDVRAVMAIDDALLIQTASTIRGWRHE